MMNLNPLMQGVYSAISASGFVSESIRDDDEKGAEP